MNKFLVKTEAEPIDVINIKNKADQIFDLLDVSEATRQDYKYRIGTFLDFVKDTGYNHNSFLECKRHLASRVDIGDSTKNKYLAAARVFLKELNRNGVLPVDITQNVKTFQQSKKHKKDGLNDDEVSKLTEKIRQLPCTSNNTRLKAILTLLTLQGLRQIEIARLDIQDIDFVARKAYVRGKGRDDKEAIDLHPETIKALREYLDTNGIADGALFQSRSNNARNRRLTTRAIRLIVTRLLKELGINRSTHGFRHYFTTKLIKAYKGDLLEVAQYTRHKSLEMLQVYNDRIKKESDLPRYYETFQGVSFESRN